MALLGDLIPLQWWWAKLNLKKKFIQLVVINWPLGFVYDHFLNKNVYACGYKIFPLVLEVTNSRKYFIHHCTVG